MAEIDPEIARSLMPGERVQWSGRPQQGIMFTAMDIFLVPFGLFWCGIVGSVFVTGLTSAAAGAAPFFLIVPFLMLCFGLVMMLGRFPMDAWLRSRTAYAVTNQRILIARGAPFGSFTAVSRDRLPSVKLSERSGGRGTIRFGETASMFGFQNRGFSIWLPSLDTTPQFLAIDSARSVFDLIQRRSS